MKKYLLRNLLGLVILLVLLGHAAKIYHIGFIGHLDSIIYDMKIRLTMPQTMDERVVILDIDEKSLAEQGRWPWGRNRLATLMDKLFDRYGVQLVGFDVVFAEPDISSGIKSLEALAARELRDNKPFHGALRQLKPRLDYDALFAAALKNRKVVLGYYLSSIEGGHSSGALPAPTLPADSFEGRPIAFTQWQNHGGNLGRTVRLVAQVQMRGLAHTPLYRTNSPLRVQHILVARRSAHQQRAVVIKPDHRGQDWHAVFDVDDLDPAISDHGNFRIGRA